VRQYTCYASRAPEKNDSIILLLLGLLAYFILAVRNCADITRNVNAPHKIYNAR